MSRLGAYSSECPPFQIFSSALQGKREINGPYLFIPLEQLLLFPNTGLDKISIELVLIACAHLDLETRM